tara:strand:- start:4336 stop:5121 length:786 start_codon:yes stop_codon:yes gene_type:complete
MITEIKKKIINSKINLKPFPHIIIRNLLSEKTLKSLNDVLPNYDEVDTKHVIFQSSSETKKTIMPDSKIFKNLLKKNIFKEVNNNLKKIKPIILKKFSDEILKNVDHKFTKSKIKYNMNFALMKKGYLKSPHLDRRDHLISGIFYPTSEKNRGGNLQMCGVKKKNNYYDVFPSIKNLKVVKDYKINQNFSVFFLNVPWAYHAVSKYRGNSDRKYFYIDYDFNLRKSSSATKNRKKGLNKNSYWKVPVEIKSLSRKKIFFKE